LHDAGDIVLGVRAAAWEVGAGEAIVLTPGEHEGSTDEEASATPRADEEAGGEGPGSAAAVGEAGGVLPGRPPVRGHPFNYHRR
jgi:hypothetical protein